MQELHSRDSMHVISAPHKACRWERQYLCIVCIRWVDIAADASCIRSGKQGLHLLNRMPLSPPGCEE